MRVPRRSSESQLFLKEGPSARRGTATPYAHEPHLSIAHPFRHVTETPTHPSTRQTEPQ